MTQQGMGRGLQGFLELAGISGKNPSVFNVLRINSFPAGKTGIKLGVKKAGEVKILGEKADSQKLGLTKLPADLFGKSWPGFPRFWISVGFESLFQRHILGTGKDSSQENQ